MAWSGSLEEKGQGSQNQPAFMPVFGQNEQAQQDDHQSTHRCRDSGYRGGCRPWNFESSGSWRLEAEQWLNKPQRQSSQDTDFTPRDTMSDALKHNRAQSIRFVTSSTTSCSFGTHSQHHTITTHPDQTDTRTQTISIAGTTVHNLGDFTVLVSPLGHKCPWPAYRGKSLFLNKVNATRRTKHSINGVLGIQEPTRYRRFGARRNRSSCLSFSEWHVLDLKRKHERWADQA